MHYSDYKPYSEEVLAICRPNSWKALEAFIRQKRETDPDYTPPLVELLHASIDC
jgi:hypothetical protein